MDYSNLQCFKVAVESGVATCLIDHPPLNLMDLPWLKDLLKLQELLDQDDSVRVIVFRSSDPKFFVAHADLHLLLNIEEALNDEQLSSPQNNADTSDQLTVLNGILERFRKMPKVTIAQIEGQAHGGGSEFALGLDMRFAAIETARLSQPEVALGIIPGGGGCARLPELVGRSRALEIILGCQAFSAREAEAYGYINRALPASEISEFVDTLALRIASFPSAAIEAAKDAVDGGATDVTHERVIHEQNCFLKLVDTPESIKRMKKALSMGAQQRDVEAQGFDNLMSKLSEK